MRIAGATEVASFNLVPSCVPVGSASFPVPSPTNRITASKHSGSTPDFGSNFPTTKEIIQTALDRIRQPVMLRSHYQSIRIVAALIVSHLNCAVLNLPLKPPDLVASMALHREGHAVAH
jgi:hypothetical protein